jgi:hypothetical protein
MFHVLFISFAGYSLLDRNIAYFFGDPQESNPGPYAY